MFKMKKKEAQDADVSILDELIAKCEDSIAAGATYYLTCRPTGATVSLNGRISATRIA